jgi:hypothetical protein
VSRLPFAVLVLVLAGCGGGGSAGPAETSSGRSDKRPIIGGKEIGLTTNCLIDENWLVQPEEGLIQGTSAAGLNFQLTFYATAAEAKAHLGKKKLRVENAVFDYGFSGGQNVGVTATTAVLGTEAATIERCLAAARR